MKPTISQSDFDARIGSVSEDEWKRLAMCIDCEGSITIAKHGHNLRLQVGNVSPFLMNWLSSMFTGNVYAKKAHQCRNRIVMMWIQLDNRAEAILRRVQPYMLIKRAQVDLALEFRVLRKLSSRGRKNTEEDLRIRESYRHRMISLNGVFGDENSSRRNSQNATHLQ